MICTQDFTGRVHHESRPCRKNIPVETNIPTLIGFRKGVGRLGAIAPVQHDDHTHARKEELKSANMSHIEICRATRDNRPGSKVPSRTTYVTGTVSNGASHYIYTSEIGMAAAAED